MDDRRLCNQHAVAELAQKRERARRDAQAEYARTGRTFDVELAEALATVDEFLCAMADADDPGVVKYWHREHLGKRLKRPDWRGWAVGVFEGSGTADRNGPDERAADLVLTTEGGWLKAHGHDKNRPLAEVAYLDGPRVMTFPIASVELNAVVPVLKEIAEKYGLTL